MSRIHVCDHPLAEHHLSLLRNRETSPDAFRREVCRLSGILTIEAGRTLPLRQTTINTPLMQTGAQTLSARMGLVPILRAGLGMSEAVLELIPEAEIWHLGFYRDEVTLEPVEYYRKFSDSPPDIVWVLDPMLATGGSASNSLTIIREWGVAHIALLCIIAAPEGIERIQADHPDVDVYTCAVDDCLNDKAYILPGLGDAGDRIFNTPPE